MNPLLKRLKFDKGSLIYLTGGRHISELGVIESIKDKKITFKLHNKVFETSKDYAFVIGDNKPVIKLAK